MKSSVLIPAAIRGRYSDNGGIVQRLELRPDKCTNTLTSVQKDNIIVECCIDIRFSTERSEDVKDNGICPCVNSAAGMGGGQTPIAMRPGFRVRKLTPKECWRLMGFDDEDFEKARNAMNDNIYNGNDRSSSQLYKQAGNSIVVDVLQHIMENLYDAMPYLFDDMSVGSFFSGIGAFEKALTRLDEKKSENIQHGSSAELTQVGYINDYNGDANRVYDGAAIARALKAEAGGGGAKTGWYKV